MQIAVRGLEEGDGGGAVDCVTFSRSFLSVNSKPLCLCPVFHTHSSFHSFSLPISIY